MKKINLNLSNIACVSVFESDMKTGLNTNDTSLIFADFCDSLEDQEIAFDVKEVKGRDKVIISFTNDLFVESYSTKLCLLLKQYVEGFSEIIWRESVNNSVLKGINAIMLSPTDIRTSEGALSKSFQGIEYRNTGVNGIYKTIHLESKLSLRQQLQTDFDQDKWNKRFQKILANNVSSISRIIWN